jgi:ABC-type branched-subunit amino acid transport system ATPase component
MLQIKHLDVKRGGLQVLWDASLEIRQNEIVALIGSNGAGKTTLLSAVVGLLKPAAGNVQFHETDVTGLAPHKFVKIGSRSCPKTVSSSPTARCARI